jgi:hypothetical protein
MLEDVDPGTYKKASGKGICFGFAVKNGDIVITGEQDFIVSSLYTFPGRYRIDIGKHYHSKPLRGFKKILRGIILDYIDPIKY